MTEWRDVLTSEEAHRLAAIEANAEHMREAVRSLQRDRRAIYLRAKKRIDRGHKTVDMAAKKA